MPRYAQVDVGKDGVAVCTGGRWEGITRRWMSGRDEPSNAQMDVGEGRAAVRATLLACGCRGGMSCGTYYITRLWMSGEDELRYARLDVGKV